LKAGKKNKKGGYKGENEHGLGKKDKERENQGTAVFTNAKVIQSGPESGAGTTKTDTRSCAKLNTEDQQSILTVRPQNQNNQLRHLGCDTR